MIMVELGKANALDYVRFVVSALLLLFSLVVTSYAIVEQKTGFWNSVPGWVALILFLLDLFILGLVEGLQIALVELKRQHPDAYKNTHPLAHHLGQVSAQGDNVERFLVGRQVCVVVLVFFAAKLTTIHGEGDFLFPTPYWFRAAFLETGFVACLVVVVIAQLMPQIVAARYPVHFLQFLIMRPTYYMCVFLEMTGLAHCVWLLSALMEVAAGMKDDPTTVNPLIAETACDAIDKINISLESSSDSFDSDGNGTQSDEEKAVLATQDLAQIQYSRFTKLVDKVNNTVSPDALRVVRHYLDAHPEKFSQFPSVIGNKMYPAPMDIALRMREDGYQAPSFLTDISDPHHVPPHIVACELLVQNRQLQQHLEQLQYKLDVMA